MEELTPEEIVARLDRHIVGQEKAKRKVAVALRNRWRRKRLPPELAAEVYPKNILLIGPTGVGKTEIARRLAGLAKAPFLKVEASKFSEVGYHGRDVETMVRDLVEVAVRLVQQEKAEEIQKDAQERTEERILEALYQREGLADPQDFGTELDLGGMNGSAFPEELPFVNDGGLWRPMASGSQEGEGDLDREEREANQELQEEREAARRDWKRRLEEGELEDEVLEIEVKDRSNPTLSIMGPAGQEAMGIDGQALQELWGRGGPKYRVRKLRVGEARRLIQEEEAEALVDPEEVQQEAVRRVENDGILFIDEIDKVIGSKNQSGPDVSREGVQRDLLTIVEGCTVYTRYGFVNTDHILFIAAGAFHFHKPSELIPELQGRFPVRVALRDLEEEDFARILVEPQNSLVRQYTALLETEGVKLSFTEGGIRKLAQVAYKANRTTQNIGARRLMTTLELLLEGISFDAPNLAGKEVIVDETMVTECLGDAADDPDLIKYMI
ncbi:MAG TPA: ATP-dependent protease ATPase subunit HslU [Planctomycetes bacterium]|nr:ATP-dependent protease ATPase subunit HslU [Planctomycetota bacterium]